MSSTVSKMETELIYKLSRAIADERYWRDRAAGYYKHESQRKSVAEKVKAAEIFRLQVERDIEELRNR